MEMVQNWPSNLTPHGPYARRSYIDRPVLTRKRVSPFVMTHLYTHHDQTRRVDKPGPQARVGNPHRRHSVPTVQNTAKTTTFRLAFLWCKLGHIGPLLSVHFYHRWTTSGFLDVVPVWDMMSKMTRGSLAIQNMAKPSFSSMSAPLRCKFGHFYPFSALRKLFLVFQIYFWFETWPQK